MESVRLNKFLSEAGICSRRKADEYIEDGRITVDGQIAVPGIKVTGENVICLDGKSIKTEKAKPVLLAVNKPRGIVCTTSGKDKDNIVDYLNYPERIYPVGRLDKDSEGLILMSNQGELMNQILKGSNCHEKEYVVKVRKAITNDFLKAMREGVPIPDMNQANRHDPDATEEDARVIMTRKCKVERIDNYTFSIVLTQGLNRQIRRMCDFLGYRVETLKRVRVMNIELGNLPLGQYRVVEGEEYERLLQLVNRGEGKKISTTYHRGKRTASDGTQRRGKHE